jgi:hypothetical protein
MLVVTLALYGFGSWLLFLGRPWVWVGLAALVLAVLSSLGFFSLQPNEARVLILGGRYRGTTRQVQDLAARPHPERRAAEGQRPRGQPGRDRRGGCLAR